MNARSAIALAAVVASSCGAPLVKLPSGPGAPAPDAAAAVVLAHEQVRNAFKRCLDALSDPSRGTSARIGRAILLAEPPSLDVGEVTDKGSINQRAVLAHRAGLVEELYADPPSANVIIAPSLSSPASRRGLGRGPTAQAS